MRVHGTLRKWNEARGFGFVARDMRDEEVFVHISAFPQDGARPRVGEALSFEIVDADDGKRRAISVVRRGQLQQRPRRSHATNRRRFALKPVAALVALAVLASFAYQKFATHAVPVWTAGENLSGESPRTSPAAASSAASFRCDGRTRCSQMTSCAEATYFLQHCPNVRMDGDHDGIPCESQWCAAGSPP
jgi:cold shock CspA family protein